MKVLRRGGFTLVEVMVALAITAMLTSAMMTTLWFALRARQEVETLTEPLRDGPRILALIERDLKGLLTYDVKGYQVLRGLNLDIGGVPADRIDMLATTDSVIPIQYDDRPILADWCEVGYWVRANPDSKDLLELYRREDAFGDEEPWAGGQFQLLSRRVREFNVTYFASLGLNAELLDEWDSAREGLLPRRIRFELVIEREAATARNRLAETKDYEGRLVRHTLEFVLEPWQVECLQQGNVLAPLLPPGPPEKPAAGPLGGGLAGGPGPMGSGPGPLGNTGPGPAGAPTGRTAPPRSGDPVVNFQGGGGANLQDLLNQLGGGRGGGAGNLGGLLGGAGGGRR